MLSTSEAHCNDLKHHLEGVDDEEHVVDDTLVLGHPVNLFGQSERDAVEQDDAEDEVIEVRVDHHHLDDGRSEWVRDGQATQRHRGVVSRVGFGLGS